MSENARILRVEIGDVDSIRKYMKPTPTNARNLAGLTREQAAKELEISFYALRGIELGTNDVSLKVARKMEKLYGYSMDEMFPAN